MAPVRTWSRQDISTPIFPDSPIPPTTSQIIGEVDSAVATTATLVRTLLDLRVTVVMDIVGGGPPTGWWSVMNFLIGVGADTTSDPLPLKLNGFGQKDPRVNATGTLDFYSLDVAENAPGVQVVSYGLKASIDSRGMRSSGSEAGGPVVIIGAEARDAYEVFTGTTDWSILYTGYVRALFEET